MTVHVAIGDEVAAGDPLVTIHWNRAERLEASRQLVERALTVGDGPADAPPLIYEEVR